MNEFINHLQSQGIYSFEKKKAKEYLKVSDIALKNHLIRYSQKNRIVRIRSDFYIILPIEYQNSGILPPFWFIDDLMKYFKRDYYVGLMSAASSHGASHQQPQVFQVIANKKLSEIVLKGVRIQFHIKNKIDNKYVVDKKTETGYVKISDPNLSVMDLIQYNKKCGGLNNVASIIKEMAPVLDAEKIVDISEEENKNVNLRRLGYILDYVINEKSLAEQIRIQLPEIKFWSIIDPTLPMKGSEYNKEWGLYVNREIEIDEI